MSIISSTRCGMLGCKLTDEFLQHNLGFNGDIFREFGNFFGTKEYKTFIHKDYPNLIIVKIELLNDTNFYYITYVPLMDVFGKVLFGDWKKFEQTPEFLRFRDTELKYVYCGNHIMNNGYDVLNFIDEHKDFLEKSAKSIYEAANFLIKNSNQYRGIRL